MNRRELASAGAERRQMVSVPRAVAAFLVAWLVVLTAIGVVLTERRCSAGPGR